MIRLYIFPASLKGTPNPSSFCLKLEAALRLAGVPHEVCYETDPRKAPKGKLPFIEIEGRRIGDSTLVLDHLRETLGVDLDRGLSEAEKAQSHMLQRMLDERLYWVIVHSRWIEEANWPTVKALFFSGLPVPLSAIVPRMARKSVRATLTAHGIGRHAVEEIYAFGKQDLAAVAAMLGDKPFFFGDKPTLADVSVFATFINITGPEMESPLKEAALGHENLLRHAERMGEIYASTRQKQRIALTLAA
jgi:glutathione S-transferase